MDAGMLDDASDCELCGEEPDFEMTEYYDATAGRSKIAHAQCIVDAGLPLA